MTFRASREIAAPPSSVYAAFGDVAGLAVWWGPAGFTSTFKSFEFTPGGKWAFTMHGPDERNYSNEIVVIELEPPNRIVLHHVSGPRYLLTVTLDSTADGGTSVGWHQDFENADVGGRLEPIVVPANEELLDRLQRFVESHRR